MKYALIISLLSFLFVSCSNRNSNDTGNEEETAYKSQSYKLVEKNINDMANSSWSKSYYLEIRDKQIPMLKKNSERMSASTLLETEYSQLLVREANKVLDNGCAVENPHSLLSNLMKELSSYPKVPGLSELKATKKIHDDAESFANSGVGYQSVTTYRTPYDKNYESKKKSTASSYLGNQKLKCGIIKKKLTNLTQASAYNSRRKAYCESVTKLYLQTSNSAASELNAAKACLNIFNGDKSDWKSRMDEHYKELNSKK